MAAVSVVTLSKYVSRLVALVQGTLPVDYLDDRAEFSSQGIFTNARQMLEQFNASISVSLYVVVLLNAMLYNISLLNKSSQSYEA